MLFCRAQIAAILPESLIAAEGDSALIADLDKVTGCVQGGAAQTVAETKANKQATVAESRVPDLRQLSAQRRRME